MHIPSASRITSLARALRSKLTTAAVPALEVVP
jgi:hypothetical protein